VHANASTQTSISKQTHGASGEDMSLRLTLQGSNMQHVKKH